MKYIVILLLSVFVVSCKKDRTAKIDITSYEWSMVSFSDGKKKRITKKDHQYSLLFSNDSIFQMSTSVNFAGGKINLDLKGSIALSYSTTTEICCENETNKRLLKLFPNITSYKVLGNFLYFENHKEYIKFKKKQFK